MRTKERKREGKTGKGKGRGRGDKRERKGKKGWEKEGKIGYYMFGFQQTLSY